MSAATGPSGAPRELGRDPGRPEHLVVWPRGDPRVDSHCVIEDEVISEQFSLQRFLSDTWAEHPTAVVAATFPGRGNSAPASETWLDLATRAAGVDGDGGGRAFTGDTTPTSLRALRQWASTQVDALPHSSEDVVLVTSELSTNVERHARGWLTVDVVRHGDMVVVAVTDPLVTSLPAPRDVPADEVSGRGLLVVASIASAWGVVVRPSSKSVWAALSA